MTQAVAVRQEGAVTSAQAPRVSPRLFAVMREAANPYPRHVIVVPEWVRLEAEAALAIYEKACAPAAPAAIRAWLLPINAGVANALATNGEKTGPFDQRAAAIAVACSDLPASVLTADAQRAAMREWKFFPAAADVHQFLKERCADLLQRRAALKLIAAAPAEKPAPVQTEEQRAKIAQGLRNLSAELEASARAKRQRDPVKVAHLDPVTLRASYIAQGVPVPPYLAEALR